MFAQSGRWPADARRVPRDLDRRTDTLEPSFPRTVQLNQVAVLPELGLLKELGAVEDRRAGEVMRLQFFRPLILGPCQENMGEDRVKRITVRSTGGVCPEYGVRSQMNQVHGLAEPLPFLL